MEVPQPHSIANLLTACGSGDLVRVREFVQAGCNVLESDAQGITPLFMAIVTDQHRVIELLIEAGARPQDLLKQHPTWPHDYLCNQAILGVDSIRAISKAPGWSWDASKDSEDRTVLTVIAAEQGSVSVEQAAALIEGGASTDAADRTGFTPLVMAAFNGSEAMVRLIGSRSDVNAVLSLSVDDGATALHIASTSMSAGRLERVAALLEIGADPSIRDARGRKARNWAEDSGHSDVVALLDAKVAQQAIHQIASHAPDP